MLVLDPLLSPGEAEEVLLPGQELTVHIDRYIQFHMSDRGTSELHGHRGSGSPRRRGVSARAASR